MEIEYVTVATDPQVTEYIVEEAEVESSFSLTHVKTEPDQDPSFNENNVQVPSPALASDQIKLEPDAGTFEHAHLYLDQNAFHTQEIYVAQEEQPAEVLYQIKGEMEESDSDGAGCGWFNAKGKKRQKRQKKKQRKAQTKTRVQVQSTPTQVGVDSVELLLGPGGLQGAFESYICTECGISFHGKENMLLHLQSHMKERTYPCSQCRENFPDSGSLLRHVQCEHTLSEEYHCSLCGMRFQTLKAFARHMRVHSGDGAFACSVCGKSFRHKSSLTRHLRTHRLEEDDSVNLCGYSSSSSSSSSSTSDSSSRTVPSPVPAPKLVIYERATAPKSFLCVECGKRFNHSSSLSRHKLTHAEEKKPPVLAPKAKAFPKQEPPPQAGKPFKCAHCDKYFSHSSSLCRHVQTHKLRPYQCPVCRKDFLTPAALSSHWASHQGKKGRQGGRAHSCFECGKTFCHSSSLSRHRSRCHHSGALALVPQPNAPEGSGSSAGRR